MRLVLVEIWRALLTFLLIGCVVAAVTICVLMLQGYGPGDPLCPYPVVRELLATALPIVDCRCLHR